MTDSKIKGWEMLVRNNRGSGSYRMSHPARLTKTAVTIVSDWMIENDLDNSAFVRVLFNNSSKKVAFLFSNEKVGDNFFVVSKSGAKHRGTSYRVVSNSVIKKMIEFGYPQGVSFAITKTNGDFYVIEKPQDG